MNWESWAMSARGKSVPKQTLPGPCLSMMAVSVLVPTFFRAGGQVLSMRNLFS